MYNELRAKYPVFNYNGFNIEEQDENMVITYDFEIVGLSEFNPTWTVKKAGADLNDSALRNMVFSLGMVELVSYWKITCSPQVNVKCGNLDKEQIQWWKKLYFNGLGECFFLNNIVDDVEHFMNISCDNTETFTSPSAVPHKGCMIPVGGGKDSSVSLSVLEDFRKDNWCYIINPRGATLNTVKVADYEDKTLVANRTLDKRMLDLNKQGGFINGHTPFSAIVAFSAILVAYINGIKYVALSNESSANESTVEGSYVNHQYSKSFEFENDFREYEEQYIKSGVYYFSLLRPLSEYQIAGLFANYTKFHPIFRSCNAGSKEDIWCGNCPKCLFVYIIMSPFIKPQDLVSIFGSNLFEKESLMEDFKKLIGMAPEKPFECVGSRDEINFALAEAVKKYDTLPLLLEYYKTTDLYKTYSQKTNPYNGFYDSENCLPPQFEDKLKGALKCINS